MPTASGNKNKSPSSRDSRYSVRSTTKCSCAAGMEPPGGAATQPRTCQAATIRRLPAGETAGPPGLPRCQGHRAPGRHIADRRNSSGTGVCQPERKSCQPHAQILQTRSSKSACFTWKNGERGGTRTLDPMIKKSRAHSSIDRCWLQSRHAYASPRRGSSGRLLHRPQVDREHLQAARPGRYRAVIYRSHIAWH